jgi:hypothetical protein
MDSSRQKTSDRQLPLAFVEESRDESTDGFQKGTVLNVADSNSERPTSSDRLMDAWKQWKTGKRRFAELRRLGIGKDIAAQTAGSSKRYWHISRSPALNMALSRALLVEWGLSLLHQPETKV